ncbi:MAG: hypothetical protein NHB14_20740 [Desulfosporosinus sp.]|nr:hypothetical protein [Desulfosporosinus sp.]
MDYLKELEAIQTWIKAVASLNSYRLKEAKPKVARPVILWENPNRTPPRNISQYQYVVSVRQYGRLFVSSVDQAQDVQEKLIKDLAEKYGVLPITENGETVGMIKAVDIEFTNSESLDVPFNVRYEVTYGRTRPVEPPPATTVRTRYVLDFDDTN